MFRVAADNGLTISMTSVTVEKTVEEVAIPIDRSAYIYYFGCFAAVMILPIMAYFIG